MTGSHLVQGSTVAALSAVAYNVGFAVEKSALGRVAVLDARRPVRVARTLLGSGGWCLGFAAMLAGLGLQVLALTLAPISVVQPILASGLVLLAVASRSVLGDRLPRRAWLAVGLVVAALAAVGFSESATDVAGDQAGVAVLAAVGLPALAAGAAVFGATLRRRTGVAAAAGFGVGSGLVYGVAALATKAVAAPVERMGVVPGTIHDLGRPYLYVLGVTSLAGLLMFQTGLQRCPAAVIVPVSNVTGSAFAVAAGSVVFGESLPPAGWQDALRLGGFAVLVIGILVLATGPPPTSGPTDATPMSSAGASA
ncbi:MAG: hypothetical protein ACRDXE_11215 [Acidimicrobiales bacterium]